MNDVQTLSSTPGVTTGYASPRPKPLMTPEEFRVLGLGGAIGRNAIYELLRSKRIKSIKIGRKILIPYSEVHDFPTRETNLN
jgi:excisionase family DNA binding protein